jgi:hypothetical protein
MDSKIYTSDKSLNKQTIVYIIKNNAFHPIDMKMIKISAITANK